MDEVCLNRNCSREARQRLSEFAMRGLSQLANKFGCDVNAKSAMGLTKFYQRSRRMPDKALQNQRFVKSSVRTESKLNAAVCCTCTWRGKAPGLPR